MFDFILLFNPATTTFFFTIQFRGRQKNKSFKTGEFGEYGLRLSVIESEMKIMYVVDALCLYNGKNERLLFVVQVWSIAGFPLFGLFPQER